MTPKAFALLSYLVTHPDRLVTKDELFDALWPDTVVSEAALRMCIGELRKVLGAGARAPQCIATVARRGYRFLAPVTRQAPAVEAGPAVAAVPPRAAAAAGGLLVGREAVLGRLHAAWAQARQGVRQVWFVMGEAGIGKTAVVEAFAAQVATEPGVWLAQGQCVEHYGTREAYGPVLEALGQLVRAPGGARLSTLLRQQAPTWLVQLPWLLTEADRGQFPHALQGTTRERMLRELAEVVETLTAEIPLVLVLEDLHWSDYATLDLLALLAQRRTPARLLLLGTYRPADVIVSGHPLGTVVQTLDQHAQGHILWLEPLTVSDVATYLHGYLGGSQVPTTLVQALYQRTEGHPLFLCNVVATMVRQGALVQVGASWTMAVGATAVALPVPESLRPLIEQQLEQLSPTEQQVLEAASVAGMTWTVAAVAAGLETDARVVDALCATLARRGQFLEPSGETRWPDGTLTACYQFRHSVYHDVIYHRTPLGRRQRLHQRIGAREEAGYGARAGERAAGLAEHFTRGGDAPRAVHYLRQAGDTAVARLAFREAVACYEQALALVAQLPDSRATREQAIDLWLALRSALNPLGEFGRILACLREAETLAAALDDPRRLAQVSLFLSFHFYTRGAHAQADAAGQRALARATTSGDAVLHALAHHYLGFTYHAQGAYRRAIACHRQTVAALDGAQRHERFGLPIVPVVYSQTNLAVCYAELGQFAAGQTCGEAGLQLAEAVAHPGSLLVASWGVGLLALRQGDLGRALPQLERALGICQAADLPLWLPWVAAALGAAYTRGGRVADALPLLMQALAQTTATGWVSLHVLCGLSLGGAQARAGHLAEAQASAEQAVTLARAHQERGHEAYARHLLGAIAVRRDPPAVEQAVAHYQQALALADALGMRPLVAHCHRGLGMLYATTGQREQAYAELSTASALYRAMAMTYWLPQTEAVLAQVEGP
jgi:DNA-binding winged helix-turn-helix (wHTH) protein/tetratricopeptide (TPR) repeat protein